MADRALRAAAEALGLAWVGKPDLATVEGRTELAAAAVAAYLDALLEELPEEAVEAAARSLSQASSLDFATAWNFLHPPGALEAFLRSLRQGAG